MSSTATPALTPRKLPIQQRSSATVEAILEATIQVLLKEGKERLTTTRVAERAGVSVGTLYQYFPNKSSLLQATLCRHLDEVAETIRRTCAEQRNKPIAQMVASLIDAFFAAKMRDPKVSVALYSVSSDVDGWRIAQQMSKRAHKELVTLFETAPEALAKEPELIASIFQSMLNGVSRRLLESPAPEKNFPAMRQELLFLAEVYVQACTASPSRSGAASAAGRISPS